MVRCFVNLKAQCAYPASAPPAGASPARLVSLSFCATSSAEAGARAAEQEARSKLSENYELIAKVRI